MSKILIVEDNVTALNLSRHTIGAVLASRSA